ncbi:xyloglucan galactosyltransferase XLT2-like [Salvia miltiorrhiza]|uniref:xyloglucan galactosyltransferase XLT2-like n=1 Tax=Salvia miltiorrhiza TaxID=226208 RepID=UPI0025ABC4B7|nr:xyloglucan galactosyltransferase XLT2-like [Salvia miltiorrhiza]
MLDHSTPHFHTHKKPKNLSPKNTNYRIFFFKCSQLFLVIIFQVFIIHFLFRSPSKPASLLHQDTQHKNIPAPEHGRRCKYGTVYVYDLPAKFNQDLLDHCDDLDPWHSRCKAVSNNGLGPRAASAAVPENLAPAWYWTDMFAGEVLYHSRMLRHECRTTEPESATAFYIPFYAGLAVGKYLFTNYTARERDAPCTEMLRWVSDQPPWRRSGGANHFLMFGRMTWDFRRSRDDDWGSGFIHMPLMKRVLRVGVERDPWDPLEVSVPYPTGFHPRSDRELVQWMEFVRTRNRTSRFTFVGGKREVKGDFRAILQNHCRNESDSCRVVDCSGTRCYDGTSEILEAFLASDFCLQPRGDAYTRRSTFDCMLAGSIPVFFWKRSISDQYEWFLGDEPGQFSVFIDRREVRNGTKSIRKVLEGYSRDEVRRKREKLISLMPNFVYSSGEDGTVKDAFHVAIDGVLRRFHNHKSST